MNKLEAIKAIKEGKKVTHRLFDMEEFVMKGQDEGTVTFEDGVSQSEIDFWSIRRDRCWDNDWSIWG